ncbi:MAG: tetratricopeptide repeat protein [Chitinophagales bacterium]
MQNAIAQKGKIVDAQLSLQAGKIMEAKKSIDEALSDAEIQKRVDAWTTKGDVYKQIYEGKLFYAQNPNCLFDAKDAYLKAYELELNPKKQKKNFPSMEMLYSYLFNEGFERFNSKKYDDAFKHFKASQDIDAFLNEKQYKSVLDTNNIFAAGIAAANANDLDAALPYLKKLVDMNYNNAAVYETLAQIYDNKKQEADLKAIVVKGLAKYPDNKNLQIYELNATLDGGDLSESISKFESAVAKDPKNASIIFNLAVLYDKNKQTDKAKETYDKAIAIKPDYGDAYFNIGVMYFNEGVEINKSMNAIDDKDDPLGKKYNELKVKRDAVFQKALPYLEKAYEIDPNNIDYKSNLKKVYASMNMLEKAKALGN